VRPDSAYRHLNEKASPIFEGALFFSLNPNPKQAISPMTTGGVPRWMALRRT